MCWYWILGVLERSCVRDAGLESSVAAFCSTRQASSPSWGRGFKKLLIPLKANISRKLEDEDDSIHLYDNLPNNVKDRVGPQGAQWPQSPGRARESRAGM